MQPTQTTPADAMAATTKLSPALVTEIQENPDLLKPLTIGHKVLIQDDMVRRALDPETPLSQKIAVYESLDKSQRGEKTITGGGMGSGVVIQFIYGTPNTPSEKTVTIDATPINAEPQPANAEDPVQDPKVA